MAGNYEEIAARLTGPGAPFEIQVEPVRGRPMRCFRSRERSLREKIANAAGRGDATCLVQGERRVSYAEFARLVWGAAHALRERFGLRRGDRFAVLAYNSPDWLITLFGATSAGGIGVGLNGWWTADEIDFALRDSGSRFLVVDERLYPRVAPLLGRLPSLETIFYLGTPAPPGTASIEALLEPRDDVPDEPIDEDDPFVLLYTSGTTGRPKGCITTHRGTIAQVLGILFGGVVGAMLGGASPLPSDGTQPATLLTSPLFHVAGLHSGVCTALTAGAKLVFLGGKFDPEEALRAIERERITVWGAVPTMLHRVVHHPRLEAYDLSSLRAVSFGAAPMPSETLARARAVLPVKESYTNAYGLTETHGVATLAGGQDLFGREGSIGRPLPVLEMQVLDADGRRVPDGEVGELYIFGPTVTPGYWNRPDATADSIRDGWLRTGDLGVRDPDGLFRVVDRAKDMILRGGENVYCVEIEDVLAEHPSIDEAAVVGVPDAELGERVKAVVRVRPGASLTPLEVQRHVAARLALFKVPELVEITDQPLPRNAAGKVTKNRLRGPAGGVPAPDAPAT